MNDELRVTENERTVRVESWKEGDKVGWHVIVDVSGDDDLVEFTCNDEKHARDLAQLMCECTDIWPA